MMQDHKTNLLQNIEKIQEDGILNGDACSLYADIFEFQSETNRLWEKVDLFPVHGTDASAPVEVSSLKFESGAAELLGKSFREICSVIQKHNEGMDTSAAMEMAEAVFHSIAL
jgi:hypothetical protein